MVSINKRLQRFLRNPLASDYREIEYLLKVKGFIKIKAKGSHVKFKHEKLLYDLIIPVHHNDCKMFYKKYAAKILKELIINKNG